MADKHPIRKVYVTANALSRGIEHLDCHIIEGETAVEVNGEDPNHNRAFFRKDWHNDWNSALLDAERRKAERLHFIEQEKEALLSLEFTEPK